MSWGKYRKIQNITKIDRDGNENVVTVSYKIKFIDSARFIQVHYEILLIISQKELIKLSIKIVIIFLNMKVVWTI